MNQNSLEMIKIIFLIQLGSSTLKHLVLCSKCGYEHECQLRIDIDSWAISKKTRSCSTTVVVHTVNNIVMQID